MQQVGLVLTLEMQGKESAADPVEMEPQISMEILEEREAFTVVVAAAEAKDIKLEEEAVVVAADMMEMMDAQESFLSMEAVAMVDGVEAVALGA